jgi:hypothetical protein
LLNFFHSGNITNPVTPRVKNGPHLDTYDDDKKIKKDPINIKFIKIKD